MQILKRVKVKKYNGEKSLKIIFRVLASNFTC